MQQPNRRLGWLALSLPTLALLISQSLFGVSSNTSANTTGDGRVPAQSQPQQKPQEDQDVIKISAELVQVDVVVVDKNNQPVVGLKREDFELYDNGKRQDISAFDYVESKGQRLLADAEEARTLPKDLTAGELKRTIAFIVDTRRLTSAFLIRAKQLLEEFVDKQMQPGDLVMIMPTGGGSGLMQQFTADPRLLRRAINRLRPMGADFGFLNLSRELIKPDDPRAAIQMRKILLDLPLEQRNSLETLRTMKNVVQSLGRLPGRKLGVFISPGFLVSQTQTTLELSEVSRLAARANVVFYSLPPSGLAPPLLGATPDLGMTLSGNDMQQARVVNEISISESENSLNLIALDTGGKLYRNSNDLPGALREMLEFNSAYYLLSFQPEARHWDGKFHKLKVAVRGRRDLTVLTRRGYVAKTEAASPTPQTPMSEMLEAVTSPLIRRDLDLELTPLYRDTDKGNPLTSVMLHLDTEPLTFQEEEGRHKSSVKLTAYIFNTNGEVAHSFSEVITMNLLPKFYEEARKHGIVVTRVLDLKPGLYQMRVVARETATGLLGTANHFFEIPDFKAARLTLSSIFAEARLSLGQEALQSSGNTLAQRRFPRNSKFAYAYFIYNARSDNGQPQLEMTMRVRRGWRTIFAGTPMAVPILEGSQLPARVATGGILQLGSLTPGDYTLEIVVTDKLEKHESRRTARQEIDFIVE